MKISRSDTIDSGYTFFSSFAFGGGEFAEQCWLEWLGGTNWEIFYCKPALKKTYRRTSSDGMAAWSTETLLHEYGISAKSFACPFRMPAELVDMASGDDEVTSVALQDDGKIVVAGSVAGEFAVARHLGDGPGINVLAAPATNVFDGISAVQFPGALPGSHSGVTFSIPNTGTANLTGLGITLEGEDSAVFNVTANPVAPVSPFGSTAFTVRFQPASVGVKNEVLHIANNVTGPNVSYDIALSGSGLTPLENWRRTWFGTPANSGDAADLAGANGNGIINLFEYALGGNPLGGETGTAILPQLGRSSSDTLEITFVRNLERTDLTLIVVAADSLLGPWTPLAKSVGGGLFAPLAPGATAREGGTGNSRDVTVTDIVPLGDPAHPARFMKLEVTR